MTIQPMNQELKEKLTKDGSHLKYTRNSGGGAGAALTLMGVFVLIFGVLAGAGLVVLEMALEGAIGIGIGIVLGGFCIWKGVSMKGKQKNEYLEYYSQKTGYTREELEEFDKEVLEQGTLVINVRRELDEKGCQECGMITRSWFQAPYMFAFAYSMLLKVSDVAVCWYETDFKKDDIRQKPSVIVIDRNGNDQVFAAEEEVGRGIVAELAKRNPNMIPIRHFTYKDREYDAMFESKEAASVYREACPK